MLENLRNNDDEFAAGFLSYSLVKGKGKEEEEPAFDCEAAMVMTIGVPRETFPGERRVATVPEVVEKLIKLGFAVAVESGAWRGRQFFR